MNRMPCHITDGPETPEDVIGYEEEDEDEAYERARQDAIDDMVDIADIDFEETDIE